jgi:hypothetical protein
MLALGGAPKPPSRGWLMEPTLQISRSSPIAYFPWQSAGATNSQGLCRDGEKAMDQKPTGASLQQFTANPVVCPLKGA